MVRPLVNPHWCATTPFFLRAKEWKTCQLCTRLSHKRACQFTWPTPTRQNATHRGTRIGQMHGLQRKPTWNPSPTSSAPPSFPVQLSRFVPWPSRDASSDHLPATSPAMTTSLARCPGRTNSGYVRSLRRRPDTKATPSLSPAPLRAVPSQWNRQVQVPDEHVRGHSSACFSADSRGDAFQCEPQPSQNTCQGARSTMMATDVKETATPASTRRQGQSQAQSP